MPDSLPPLQHNIDLRQRLNQSLASATRAEAAIAGYFLNNLDQLPFETAASVAMPAIARSVMAG